MKQNELMVGNLLTHDGRLCRVTSIIENGESNYDVETRFLKGGEGRLNSIIYVGLEPIPLTEEELVKFKEVRHEVLDGGAVGEYNSYSIGNFELSHIFTNKWGVIGNPEVELNSVHDLQNWYYYNHNKKELTIK